VQTFIAFLAGAASGVAALGCWRWRTGTRRLFASNPARARDLQLHEEADRALKQSEENFRQFFDTIEDFLFVLDDAGDILKVNRAVTARLGYDEHELLGRNILSLHPDGEPGHASAVLADLRAGKASYCTTPLQTKAGRLIPIEAREVRGTWNGQPVAFCIAKDIAGVKISEEKFAKAFHGSPALMALLRMDDLTVFDVNQALLDILGYSREEAIGKRPTELNLFVDVQQRDGLVDAMLHGRQPREVEVQLRSRSGQILDGLVSTEMLSLSHESLIMAVMVDVTERKRGEAALRRAASELERKNQELAIARDAALDASRVKSQFLANMSHEIRTPLNGMLGLTELLSRSPLSSDQQEYVDSITRCGDLLLTILNDLLDFSKIEAGRLQIESIPFDLPGLIFDVVDFYGTKASPADVELVVDFDPALPTGFLGDPGRLRQVLGNLVSNAVKFTSKGQILIKAKQERRDAGKVALSIAVSDTGEGIPEEAQGRLFQPFTQADASTSRKHGGTGLGLALCKRIVEGMGGQIDLRSRPGQGATLTVTVELPIDENRSSSLPPLAGTRCLLVDDNALVRDAMGKQLRRLGFQVATADSGEFAITAAGVSLQDGRPYDLVLVDFHMPGLGGERLAKVLRSDARLRGMGIVMLAPLVLHPDVPEGPSAVVGTCDGYLVKPARSELVAKILTMVLENKRAGRTGVVVTRHSVLPPKSHALDGAVLPFPLRVLIAEDNDVNQLVARRMLEEVGASVTVVSDGQQALSAIERGVFDLVIMDCQMPALDGFATTARIREQEKSKGGHVPILAVTANSLAGDEEHCLSAGMDGYLGKPFSRQELLGEIVRLTRARVGTEVSPPASKPNLDRVRFKDMAQLLGSASSDGHAMLLRSFQRNTEKRLEELGRAIAGRDAEAAYGVAHAIKGSSGNLGFVGLEQLAGQIERMARASQLQALSVEMVAMQEELGRVRMFLEDYCKQTAVQS
jgi:two-component system, sensor histidine kinase and response regulator